MAEVLVHGIGVDARRAQPIVLLRESGGAGRMLPIWVGEVDAAGLVSARDGTPPPRPDSHMLIGDVIRAFGRRVTGVTVTELRRTVFHAELVLDDGLRIDARASDALTVALRNGVPIDVAESVFATAGVAAESVAVADDVVLAGGTAPDPAEPVSELEVEEFRRMLDDTSPSDFDDD